MTQFFSSRAMNSDDDPDPASAHPCFNFPCENAGSDRCSACQAAWYCSKQCQRENWLLHIFQCDHARPIRNTAHRLDGTTHDSKVWPLFTCRSWNSLYVRRPPDGRLSS